MNGSALINHHFLPVHIVSVALSMIKVSKRWHMSVLNFGDELLVKNIFCHRL